MGGLDEYGDFMDFFSHRLMDNSHGFVMYDISNNAHNSVSWPESRPHVPMGIMYCLTSFVETYSGTSRPVLSLC
jgi:hypothetical protein